MWDEFLAKIAAEEPELLHRGQSQAMRGDVDDWKEWVQARAEVGVDQVIINLFAPYLYDSVERFAKEVIPAFR